jgi:hypothetical protein
LKGEFFAEPLLRRRMITMFGSKNSVLKETCVTAAIFALAGTFLGILGTLAIEMRRGHLEDDRSRREALRLTAANFADAIIRMKELTFQYMESPQDESFWKSAHEAHAEARAQYERLRFVTTSEDVQKAGRHVIRYSWGIMLMAGGHTPREDEKGSGPVILAYNWLLMFYTAVRRELGLPRPDHVYREPDEWLGPAHQG